MDKDTTKSTFDEVLKYFPFEKFYSLIKEVGADRYIKKLFVIKLLYIMFIAQITQAESLRALAKKIKGNTDLQDSIKLDSISFSQLSRRLGKINSDTWGTAFSQVVRVVIQKTNHLDAIPQADRIHIIDASTITLCLSSYRWADYRKTKAGVKIHQCLVYQDGYSYPDRAILTTARNSDKSQLDELLITDPNALYVFDRGYVDYKKWDEYCEAGIRFVTRIKDSFTINIIDEKPVDGTNMTESTVILGSKKTMMRNKLRLVHTVDTKGSPVVILTNDFNIGAKEISEIYRRRWKVELFFKWIKQHLKVKNFYGKSANAVYNQIWMALITYCLLLLLTRVNLKAKKSMLEIQRLLKETIFKPFDDFLEILQKQPTRTSRGRRKNNPEEQFEQLLRQVECGDILFLDIYGLELNCL